MKYDNEANAPEQKCPECKANNGVLIVEQLNLREQIK